MKPGTPLPWQGGLQISGPLGAIIAKVQTASAQHGRDYSCPHAPCEEYAKQNAAYLVHAANAYPKLVEALVMTLTSLEDVSNGFPENELHEPLEDTLERAASLLHSLGEASPPDAYPSGTVGDLERYPEDGRPWAGEGADGDA